MISLTVLTLLLAPTASLHEESPTADDVTLGVTLSWKTAVGPAYSRIAVHGNDVVTQSSDGQHDEVVALSAADGAVRWRHVLGPVYRGHDGSEDGPISTPALGDGRVHVLGPRGRLVTLDLATGAALWSVHLVDDLGAVPPEYGFTSSPVLEDGRLVVQAGGDEGRNLCAFDAASGDLLWSTGDGAAAYASPALLELAGRRQLVVLNDRELLGVEPETGATLWSHALGEREAASSGSAGAIDGSRFFFYSGGQLAVYRVTSAGGGFVVEPLYRTRELGGTYAKPVYHDGYLYGFKSSFLTCVDVESGARVWKSRPPGGRGLALSGDHLVVYGAEGVVAVVRATPDGYFEDGRAQALETSGYTWPCVVEGRVFVRNGAELARLDLIRGAEKVTTQQEPEAAPADHEFGRFLGSLATLGLAERGARIDAYLGAQERLPILEGDHVHFVVRAEAEDVAVVGSMTGGRVAEPLQRVEGTDLWHRTYAIAPGARWEYRVQIDYGNPGPDPQNPRQIAGERGPVSEVVTPDYQAPTDLDPVVADAGRLESHEFHSEQLDNTRTLQVYLPDGYDEGDARYPLLLVHDGPEWLEAGALKNILDHRIGDTVRPLVAVFIPPLDEWWFEAGGSLTEPYVAMLATELVPWLEQRYRLIDDPAARAVHGVRGTGLTAALAVAQHGDVFGKAAVQSVSLEDVARHALFERLASAPAMPATVYLDWNRYEQYDHDRGVDYAAYGPRLREALRGAGVTVIGGEVNDSHGFVSWRTRAGDWLAALFPGE